MKSEGSKPTLGHPLKRAPAHDPVIVEASRHGGIRPGGRSELFCRRRRYAIEPHIHVVGEEGLGGTDDEVRASGAS